MAIEGKVAAIVNERDLAINQGSDNGVTEGMIFKVMERPLKIIDPDNRTALGELSREKVRVKISDVQPMFSVGKTYETYQTTVASPFPSMDIFARRTVTKVRTLHTSGRPFTQVDEETASVEKGDPVIQVEERERFKVAD